MSRIGKSPIVVPAGVDVKISPETITVKGSSATLSIANSNAVKVELKDGQISVSAVENAPNSQAMWGTMRANLFNMITGVSKGFEKKLQLIGVGYRAQVQGNALNLSLGFSHPVVYQLPEGIKAECFDNQTGIILKGADKQKIGQVAAEIRAYRKPEPYKGKGVRYADEVVIIKETKKK